MHSKELIFKYKDFNVKYQVGSISKSKIVLSYIVIP
jgi:hypothetical protein